jgi:hypothetical protein
MCTITLLATSPCYSTARAASELALTINTCIISTLQIAIVPAAQTLKSLPSVHRYPSSLIASHCLASVAVSECLAAGLAGASDLVVVGVAGAFGGRRVEGGRVTDATFAQVVSDF